MRVVAALACAMTLICVGMLPSHAEKRVALVIGNSSYGKVARLPNPANDAAAIAGLFSKAGFDVVQSKSNLDLSLMRRALRDFTDAVREADVAVVFYAGHGIEVNGTNYLIPVDAVLERDIDVEDETVSLDRVSQIIEAARRLRVVILDACRDNPFASSMKRTVANRSIGRGLGRVDVMTADTLVAFAARAGSTAADGSGANSPYTTALLQHLVTPGLDVRLALGRVRDQVLASTGGRQEPFVYGSLGGAEVSLVPEAKAGPAPQPGTPQTSDAERAWALAKDTTSQAVLEGFIQRYGDTFYALLARARLDELKKSQLASKPGVAIPSPSPAPAPTPARKNEGAIASLAAGAKVKFGLVAPSSGFWFDSYGKKPKAAMDFAADLINNPRLALAESALAGSRGLSTLNGAAIEVDVTKTDQYFWGAEAAAAVRRLIDQDHVVAIAGTLRTLTSDTSKIADQVGIPVISAESFFDAQSFKDAQWLFLINPSDSDILKNYIKFLTDTRKSGRPVRSIGILGEDYFYFQNLVKVLSEEAKVASLSIAASLTFPHEKLEDVSDQVRRLKSANPDAVILIGNLFNFGKFVTSFRDLDYRPPILIMQGETPSDASASFLNTYGNIAQGVLISSVFDPGRPGSAAYKVNQLFHEKTGSDLDEWSARNIQAFLVLADAVNRAGSTQAQDIRKALQQTDLKPDQLILSYQGIKFNSSRYNVLASSYLAQLQGASYVPVWPPEAARGSLMYPYRGAQASGR